MRNTDDSIVITGMGLASPIGLFPSEAIARLLGGETGIAAGDGEQVFARAAVPRYELSGVRNAKNQKFLNAGSRHLMWSALRALEQSGWSREAFAADRMAVFTGSGQVGMEPNLLFPGFKIVQTPEGEGDWAAVGGPAARALDIYFPLRTLSNSGLALLAMEMGARGPSNNYVQSDTAGVIALEAAMDALRAGECDLAVCGTYENLVSAANYLNFRRAGILTEPPVRPFDREANGTVIGEAGAAIVLERKSSAAARGARILGEVAGLATAMNGEDRAGPIGSGGAVKAAIRGALGDAKPDLVVLGGAAVPSQDGAEAAAVEGALGPGRIPCTAFKGATGYVGAATAVVEMVLALAALEAHQAPPVTGLQTPADGIALDLVRTRPRDLNGHHQPLSALCLSHSLMGQSAAVLLRHGGDCN